MAVRTAKIREFNSFFYTHSIDCLIWGSSPYLLQTEATDVLTLRPDRHRWQRDDT